jgi:hypothetical protein
MRKILTLAVLTALSIPSAAVADDPAPATSAAQTANAICKAELTKMGAITFKATYGTNGNGANAWGKCVSTHAASAAHDADNAAKQCKTEQASNAEAFATKYGTNKNGRNAFGKCVSQKAQESADHEVEADTSAAKSCKAERKADPAAFAKKYSNFGKCVSGTTKSP